MDVAVVPFVMGLALLLSLRRVGFRSLPVEPLALGAVAQIM